jgi:hypothetical protein
MEVIVGAIVGLAVAYFTDRSDSFIYRNKYGSWRAYFKGKPPSLIHTLHDADGYYVCWNGKLETKNDARMVAKEWTKLYG